jgi:hypothetical protein
MRREVGFDMMVFVAVANCPFHPVPDERSPECLVAGLAIDIDFRKT